jgi:Putative amidoligase enzyme
MSLTTANKSVLFAVGNTYQRIPEGNAKLDRSRRFRRVHDYKVYVDVIAQRDQVDVVSHVEFNFGSSFRPSVFSHYTPVAVLDRDGCQRWRFASRQQAFGVVSCQITLHGRGGSRLTIDHSIRTCNYEEPQVRRFVENRPQKTLGPVPLPNVKFGIELELTTSASETPDQVARSVETRCNVPVQVMTDSYSQARQTYSSWKLMRDSSIACHINRPDCNAFELVSPVLSGQDGVGEVHQLVSTLTLIRSVKVNKSMGFHVHVNVEHVGLKGLIKVCQNFVKYEKAMDSFMPKSRRNNRYCKSNKDALGTTNKGRIDRLGACRSIEALCEVMNPDNQRYFKLNMQNLRTGRMPTVEFRQHSSTASAEKVAHWVRFCILLVQNSVANKAPLALKAGRTVDDQMDMMFQYVIKDRFLEHFYQERRTELAGRNHSRADNDHDHDEGCCNECASGGVCASNRTGFALSPLFLTI